MEKGVRTPCLEHRTVMIQMGRRTRNDSGIMEILQGAVMHFEHKDESRVEKDRKILRKIVCVKLRNSSHNPVEMTGQMMPLKVHVKAWYT